ncbi:MAG: ABC transporter permease [Reichenbachiella sp.]|uniref:ABC transporter permease n=1 Tax=Reichenbachiella sp. TaxID=2184521 RepID=UPI0029661452|nr:ABC transporter permease [Reichenbachiella sp.]MDW3210443.1 ABC transporter permease [Reichenbachiella sp.]
MKNKHHPSPPGWPLQILKLLIHPNYIEEIEGDLEELYQYNLERHSTRKANRLFTKEVIKLLRPLLLKSLEGTYRMNNYGIIKNYFKIAIRSLRANKFQNALKILGITIALSASITIYQYINFESSFDKFHTDIEHLYRVDVDRIHNGVLQSQKATSYSAFGPDAQEDISGIEKFTRVRIRTSSVVVSKDSTKSTYSIQKPAFVDPSFLNMFDFGLKDSSILQEPNSIILTESTSSKYFGDQNPLGQVITVIHGRYELPMEVKAIIPDVKLNSHIQFEALIPYQAFFPEGDWVSHSWDWSGVTTYLKLREGVSPDQIESSFPQLVRKYKGEKMEERNMDYQFSLRPVEEIHLYGHLDGELEANGNDQALYFLGIAALLILAISWLNNVNLTTAHNSTRSKEMSVRRVLGARNTQVFTQLFMESLLTHGIAVFLAVAVIFASTDQIEGWLEISLNISTLFQWHFWMIAMLYVILGSLFVSFDYKLIFNQFQHKHSIQPLNTNSSISIRKAGVAFQFGILLVLIIITWAVDAQLTYIQNYNLGLDKEKVIVIEKPRLSRKEGRKSANAFLGKLENLSWVKSHTSSFQIPGSELGWTDGVRQTTQPKELGQDLYVSAVNDNYIKTLGLKLKAGSTFEDIACQEHSHVILNETATRLLGFDKPEDALLSDLINSTDRKQRVIGVIEDFHYSSLRENVEPLMLAHLSRSLDYIFVKLGEGDRYNQIDQLETTWKESYANTTFDFFFLDDQINQQYKADIEFKKLFTAFSSIASSLALMGILGLSSFYAARRIKEIGIRKVLGANLTSIIWLLSRQFMLLIVIGSALAIPTSYYLISIWFQSFAYQIEIAWVWFMISFLLVISVSWIILSLQTLKAASVNPVECLKDE